MLQGLFIRQAFKLMEFVLVVAIVAGATWAALGFAGKGDTGEAKTPDGVIDIASGPNAKLAVPGSRADYDAILTSGMFGSAGRAKQDEQAPPAPAIDPPSELHLKLLGTAATTPKDPFASATIMNMDDNNSIRVYGVGQAVVDQVTLEEIYQRRVVLFNKLKTPNRRETLRTEEDKAAVAQVAAVQPGKAPAAPRPPNHVSVKKAELVQDLFMNYNEIVTQIKPEIYKDASGKVAGITASNLESLPLAAKLNVKNGDVLQSVNGDMIDSEAKIMELINKYRNATSVNIGLLRDGRPITINYRLE